MEVVGQKRRRIINERDSTNAGKENPQLWSYVLKGKKCNIRPFQLCKDLKLGKKKKVFFRYGTKDVKKLFGKGSVKRKQGMEMRGENTENMAKQ